MHYNFYCKYLNGGAAKERVISTLRYIFGIIEQLSNFDMDPKFDLNSFLIVLNRLEKLFLYQKFLKCLMTSLRVKE